MASTFSSTSPGTSPSLGLAPLEASDETRAAAAHLLRRTALTTTAERIDRLAGLDRDAAVASVLDHRGPDPDGPERAPVTENWSDAVAWWVERMTDPDAGLTDRMAWFWHGLLTTSAHKVSDSRLIADQIDLLRAEGRGGFRTLLHRFVTGGALLDYLDASWSLPSRPNENLGRELMELFTIGRGHYDEDDVRAAARALAGWVVEDGRVEFRAENAFIAPLLFLGEQARWDTGSVVDRLCDHPATARRIAGRLWTDLVGVAPDPAVAAEMGSWWQGRDLAIEPLLERILGDDEFHRRHRRPRGGLEWFAALRSAIGRSSEAVGDDLWRLEGLGQLPYTPPSVAGWPTDDRWLAPGSLLNRAAFVHDLGIDDLPPTVDADVTVEVLRACGLHEVSASTRSALDAVGTAATADDGADPETVRLVRWRLALSSPEFNLA